MSLFVVVVLVTILVLIVACAIKRMRSNSARRAEFLSSYTLPSDLCQRLQKLHPNLDTADCKLVGRGLQHFFLAYLRSPRKISMPSHIAATLWHEFTLCIPHYEQFCQQAFGGLIRHTPAAVLGPDSQSNAGLRRCLLQVCRQEGIDPRHPDRLPLLFALDAQLNIPGGFRYAVDYGQTNTAEQGPTHCIRAFFDPDDPYFIADSEHVDGGGGG